MKILGELGDSTMFMRDVRLPTRVLVHVRVRGAGFDATIGNLSQGGARLCGVPEHAIGVGDIVQICCGGKRRTAQVRWTMDDTCGLKFSDPLSDRQIQLMLGSRRVH